MKHTILDELTQGILQEHQMVPPVGLQNSVNNFKFVFQTVK